MPELIEARQSDRLSVDGMLKCVPFNVSVAFWQSLGLKLNRHNGYYVDFCFWKKNGHYFYRRVHIQTNTTNVTPCNIHEGAYCKEQQTLNDGNSNSGLFTDSIIQNHTFDNCKPRMYHWRSENCHANLVVTGGPGACHYDKLSVMRVMPTLQSLYSKNLTARSYKVSKTRDSGLYFSNCSEIWQAP